MSAEGQRDFLLLVDGWAKDADANTAFSQSVLPLRDGVVGETIPVRETNSRKPANAVVTGDGTAKSTELAQALADGKKIVVCTIQTFPHAIQEVRRLAAELRQLLDMSSALSRSLDPKDVAALMAEHLAQRIKKEGLGAAKVEGMPQNDWVLVDAGDVIVRFGGVTVRTLDDFTFALRKRRPGDVVEVAAPGGRRSYEVVAVRYV